MDQTIVEVPPVLTWQLSSTNENQASAVAVAVAVAVPNFVSRKPNHPRSHSLPLSLVAAATDGDTDVLEPSCGCSL